MARVSTDLTGNGLSFYALASGPVPSPFEKDNRYFPTDMVPLSVLDLGVLRVPSGRVEACDPFVCLGDGLVFEVGPGDYPVRVTIADVSKDHDGSHERNAYLSLVLADGEPTAVEAAVPLRGPGHVGVDSGMVAFVDAQAAVAMADLADGANLYDDFEPEPWCVPVDSPEHYREGMANIVMPLEREGENIIMVSSGWGDGYYPVVLTRAADGAPLGLHIDLGVVGEDDGGHEVHGGPGWLPVC